MPRTAAHNESGLATIFLPKTCERLRAESIGAHLDDFVDDLRTVGYCSLTIKQYLGPAIHFGAWLARHDTPRRKVDAEVVGRFHFHLRRCRCRRRGPCGVSAIVLVAVRRLIQHLRSRRLVPVARAPSLPKIVDEFALWMRQHRGSADRTLDDYRRVVVAFVASRRGRRWSQLDAKAVRSYVIDRSKVTTPAPMLLLVRALRMFVRFLVATDRCRSHLQGAVPSVPHWRLATLPRYLGSDQVERVLAAAKRAVTDMTATHARDYAVLLLLARLALRAGEVRQLCLSDLDWRGARIRVVGKPRRPSWLPLPQEVGDAILAYLQHRPACAVPEVFLCRSAPHRRLNATGVGGICQRAIDAAGVKSPNKGAHVFRHSAATTLLRHGATLDDIGRLLRHTSRESTAIYAKVSFDSLRRVAQPWPGGAS